MNKSKIFLYLCLIFIAGIFIYSFFAHQPKEARELSCYYGQETCLKGTIVAEPQQRIDQQKFEFSAEKASGKMLVTADLYPEYRYGDKLEICGKIKEPAQFKDFDYRAYLAKDGIYAVVYYPFINKEEENKGNWLFLKIFSFKERLREIIDYHFLPPQSSLLKAVLLGDRYALSDHFKEQLNISGTRHLAAISGMHLVIFSQILVFLGLALGLWRGQVFYFVLILLVGYVLMIGAPPSAIRAALFSAMLLLAQKTGRLRSAERAVIVAAALMLLFNPLLLRFDVGFQLSFIAVLAIIYLKGPLDEKLKRLPNPFRLKDVLTITLAAQLGVLPILVFHFGRISFVSPLANLLIVPFLPLMVIGGIATIFLGLIYLPLSKIIAFPLWFLLVYFTELISLFSRLPGASYDLSSCPSLFLFLPLSLIYYLFLFAWSKKAIPSFFASWKFLKTR